MTDRGATVRDRPQPPTSAARFALLVADREGGSLRVRVQEASGPGAGSVDDLVDDVLAVPGLV